MKVTRIVKKDSKNVIVHFDNTETLILLVDIYLKSGLKNNEDVSDDRFYALIKESRLFHIKQQAFRYLARRLHSTSELRIKLMQKRYERELIDNVIEELLQAGYLNDLDFTREFTEEKTKTKLWGKNRIKAELIKRGISAEFISQVLNEGFKEDDEYEKAMITAQKKIRVLKSKLDDEVELKRKLISFLNMRGYSYEIAGKVCDELIGEHNHFD